MSTYTYVNEGINEIGTVTGHRNHKTGSSSSSGGVKSGERIIISPKAGINSIAKNSPLIKPLIDTNGMMFPYRPSITWTSNIQYGTQSLTHTIQDFKYFIRNSSITFNITGMFSCENNDTASYTFACLHFLRSVSKMHFGGFNSNSLSNNIVQGLLTTSSSAVGNSNDSFVGLPPAPLVISGYGDYMFNNLNVILESFSMNLKSEVDYVSFSVNGSTVWLPVMCEISLQLTTQNTPQKCREFNHSDFANGSLLKRGGWF